MEIKELLAEGRVSVRCDDLGYDPEACLQAAIAAQKNFSSEFELRLGVNALPRVGRPG